MTVLTRDGADARHSYSHGPVGNELRGSPAAGMDMRPIRVVFVDDDDDYREAMTGELADHGFEIVDLADGDAMFAYFADGGAADVVVLDWRLPGASGLDLLGQSRRRGIHVPMIVLTGMLSTTYENAALENGAIDFVNKSRGAAVLAKRIGLIVAAGKKLPEQRREEVAVCGDLMLRPQISRALWKGVDVNFTVVEFNIVHLLVRHVNEYVTYRAIYDCVHHAGFIAGTGEDGYRTNVRSSIKRIRNKFRVIDAEFSQIENFLAFGYRWRTIVDDGS
jgi:two-component system response regulator ChvI